MRNLLSITRETSLWRDSTEGLSHQLLDAAAAVQVTDDDVDIYRPSQLLRVLP